MNFLPLGLMAAVFRISLVTMAAVASRLIEKERLTVFRLLAVTLGIVGIVLMTQPEFIFGKSRGSDAKGVNNTQIEVAMVLNTTGALQNNTHSTSVGNYSVARVGSSVTDGEGELATAPMEATSRDHQTSENTLSRVTTPSNGHKATDQGILNTTPAPEGYSIRNNASGGSAENPDTRSRSKSLISTDNLSERQKLSIGLALTVLAAFLGIMQGICMKRRVLTDYCVWRISFWVAVSGLAWTLVLSFSLEDVVFITESRDLLFVACYAVLATAHSLTFLYALKRASYLIVAVIMVTQIVFNLIAQYTVLRGIFPGKHNAVEIVGAVLVAIAALLPTVTEGLRRRPTAASRRNKDYTLSSQDDDTQLELSVVHRSRKSSSAENGSERNGTERTRLAREGLSRGKSSSTTPEIFSPPKYCHP